MEFQIDNKWLALQEIATLPAFPGAYALVIRLPAGFGGDVGSLGPVTLAAGSYLYLGSAYGPGGVAGRLRRHLRREKRPHWHVDRLTETGRITRIFVMRDGRECDLVDAALNLPGSRAPIAGFGSSDCRRCPAHLVALRSAGTQLIDAFSALV